MVPASKSNLATNLRLTKRHTSFGVALGVSVAEYRCGLDGCMSGGVVQRGRPASFCRAPAVSAKPERDIQILCIVSHYNPLLNFKYQ